MKSIIKKIIKKLLGKRRIAYYNYAKNIYKKICKKNKKIYAVIKILINTRVYYDKNKGKELKKLIKHLKINPLTDKQNFYYAIDFFKTTSYYNTIISNISLDYSVILDNSLDDLKNKLNNSNHNEFFYEQLYTIDAMQLFIDRIINKINDNDVIKNISRIKNKKANNLYEALQRILFINMLLWQTNHRLNGLGRLDVILIKYYKKDIEDGTISKDEAKQLIKDFLLILHKQYEWKSNLLIGDTGQIIELGGKNINGEYICNELTYLFIELMEEIKTPDPKVLVRVSKNIPRDLMEKSLKCIKTGIGCPLFANDDVIIDKLINFGYDKEDAFNYGTSACWEPYLIGKSSDQNNIKSLNFMKPLEDLLENEKLNEIKGLNNLLELYKKYLKKYLNFIVSQIEQIRFEKDPLLSLFIDDCIKNSKDISKGGAKYNDLGLTGVGLANVVNSICNIEEFIFQEKYISFEDFNNIRKENFKDNENILKKLKTSTHRYGQEDEKVINITNEIIRYASKILDNKKNNLGGKYKFGLSSPNYITDSKKTLASFDGRKNGEPFSVHISTDHSNAYTELINFASKLDYNENRFNGNVVDFFVTPNFIENNFDKFVDFLLLSIKVGFFEMQMNVVSSSQLIKARKNPEKFPNLVVRVWGFSAYFKDLPDEYKDYLIERALKNESNS